MPGHGHSAPAGMSQIITGGYRALWDDLDVGLTLDGFRLLNQTTGEDITSDITGDIPVDGIHTGVTVQVVMTLQHWNAKAIEPMIWWHGNSNPASYEWGLTDGVGQRLWDNAKPLILYSCQGTGFSITPNNPNPEAPANTTITPSTGAASLNPNIDPLDIVFFKTLLAPNTNIDLLFSSTAPRYVPITLNVFPVSNTINGLPLDPNSPDSVERITDCDKFRFFSATRGTPPAPPAPPTP